MLYAEDGSSLSGEGKSWNDLVALWEKVRDQYDLDPATVDPIIQATEDKWYNLTGSDSLGEPSGGDHDPDHTVNIVRWNYFVGQGGQLKSAIVAAMNAKKLPKGGHTSLGWDELADEISSIGAAGFVTTKTNPGSALSGGHGTGTFWSAEAGGTKYTGTVPDSAHGRNDSALNSQRGMVATVVDLHNTAVDKAISSIAWPSGI